MSSSPQSKISFLNALYLSKYSNWQYPPEPSLRWTQHHNDISGYDEWMKWYLGGVRWHTVLSRSLIWLLMAWEALAALNPTNRFNFWWDQKACCCYFHFKFNPLPDILHLWADANLTCNSILRHLFYLVANTPWSFFDLSSIFIVSKWNTCIRLGDDLLNSIIQLEFVKRTQQRGNGFSANFWAIYMLGM